VTKPRHAIEAPARTWKPSLPVFRSRGRHALRSTPAWASRVALPAAVLACLAGTVAGAQALAGREQQAVPASTTASSVSVTREDAVSRNQSRPEVIPTTALGSSLSKNAAAGDALRDSVVDAARKAAKKSAKDAASLGAVLGTRWTTSALNVRTQPSADSTLRTVLDEGAEVTITNKVNGKWRQIKLDGKAGWVLNEYLSSNKVSSIATGGACTSSSIDSGLTAKTVRVHHALCAQFSSIRSYGGRRGGGGYHSSGQAIDAMIPSISYGQQVADWARAHAYELGITEVIFNHRIWTTQRAGEGWRSMSDRGGATANHEDHVHISVGG